MDITLQLTALAVQILDASPTRLSNQELIRRIIDLQPKWLPNPIYDPRNVYKNGQRLFHASSKIEDWFTITNVLSGLICVKFDSGEEMTLFHNGHPNIQFPTTLYEYVSNLINKCDLASYRRGNSLKQVCDKFRIPCFYRIDHIDNLTGILNHGILCRNEAKDYIDISDPEVQARRKYKRVPCSPELTLHDFVPLFIAPKSPMLSARRKEQPEIVYLHISPTVLNLPGAVFTDGNASDKVTQFFTDFADFDKLDWRILKARYWSSDDETLRDENSRRRSAEILIPRCVAREHIQSISVYNRKAYDRVKGILEKINATIKVLINIDFYFPMTPPVKAKIAQTESVSSPGPSNLPDDWEGQQAPSEIREK